MIHLNVCCFNISKKNHCYILHSTHFFSLSLLRMEFTRVKYGCTILIARHSHTFLVGTNEQTYTHTHSSNSYKWRSINLMNKIQPTVPLMGHVNIIDILLLLLHDCVIRKFIVEINRPKHLCRHPYSIHGSYFFFLLSVAAVAAGWWCFFFRLEIWFSVMRTITVWWWHVFSINHRTTISGFSKQMMLLLINARRRKNTHMKRRRNFFSVCELCACVNHFRNRKRCFFFLLWHLGSWKMSSCYVLRANM